MDAPCSPVKPHDNGRSAPILHDCAAKRRIFAWLSHLRKSTENGGPRSDCPRSECGILRLLKRLSVRCLPTTQRGPRWPRWPLGHMAEGWAMNVPMPGSRRWLSLARTGVGACAVGPLLPQSFTMGSRGGGFGPWMRPGWRRFLPPLPVRTIWKWAGQPRCNLRGNSCTPAGAPWCHQRRPQGSGQGPILQVFGLVEPMPPGGLEPPTHGLGNRCSIP